jgi:hypothetical protein
MRSNISLSISSSPASSAEVLAVGEVKMPGHLYRAKAESFPIGRESGDKGGEHSVTLPRVEDDVLIALVLEPSEDPVEPARVTGLVGNRLEVAVADERVGLAKLLDDLLDDGIEPFPLVIEAVPGVVPNPASW